MKMARQNVNSFGSFEETQPFLISNYAILTSYENAYDWGDVYVFP